MFILLISSLNILISNDQTDAPVKFIFERSDGSVYEKMKGAENFVEVSAGRENKLINDRLTDNHHKVVVNKRNGEKVYSYNFKDWYNLDNNSKIETSSELTDLPNYSLSPNPTSGNINVTFDLTEESTISINLYTLGGYEIAKLINTNSDQGTFEHNFNLNRFSPGIYIYQVVVNNRIYTSRIVKN